MVEDQLAPLLSSHTPEGEMKGSSGSLRGVGQIALPYSLLSPLSERGRGRGLGR